jgi:hypothetical protein
MLKEIVLLASVAENSFTGIDTSPNETVKLAIDRAAIVPPAYAARPLGLGNISMFSMICKL